MKAVPQVGARHGETVCCAGVTREGEWRRLFPIRFRRLSDDAKFGRWQWLKYRGSLPSDDKRVESRRVHEESLVPGRRIPISERAAFVNRIVVASEKEAVSKGQSLALVRPEKFEFYVKKRAADELASVKLAYADAARQTSFLDKELLAFEPPPYEFRVRFKDGGGPHDKECGDWETIEAFRNFSKKYGEAEALNKLSEIYNSKYTSKGLVLALGTMKKRPQVWLMLGIIRANEVEQLSLL